MYCLTVCLLKYSCICIISYDAAIKNIPVVSFVKVCTLCIGVGNASIPAETGFRLNTFVLNISFVKLQFCNVMILLMYSLLTAMPKI